MNDQAIAGSFPCIGTRREEIDDHPRYWRLLLKLIGAQCADLIGLHAHSLLRGVEARIRQINHKARWIADLLNRRNHGMRCENLDCGPVFFLDDAEALDRGNRFYGSL